MFEGGSLTASRGLRQGWEREGLRPSQYTFWREFERQSRSNSRQTSDLGEAGCPLGVSLNPSIKDFDVALMGMHDTAHAGEDVVS